MIFCQSQPDIGLRSNAQSVKRLCGHTDDDVRHVVESYRAPNNRSVSTELPLPKRVTQHDSRGCARGVILCAQGSTQLRPNTQDLEIVACYKCTSEPLRSLHTCEIQRSTVVRCHLGKRICLLTKVDIVRIGRAAIWSAAVVTGINADK